MKRKFGTDDEDITRYVLSGNGCEVDIDDLIQIGASLTDVVMVLWKVEHKWIKVSNLKFTVNLRYTLLFHYNCSCNVIGSNYK